ncbi:MAG: hypothetical protein DRQ55_17980, partial [Planctomycetota bacterium]
QSTGFVSMDDVLVSSGILGAPAIYQCRAMTDDGNIIVGQSGNPNGGGWAGFIFEFDTDGSWDDVGHAMAGTNGEPSLQGSGPLLPFAQVSISLSNALPSANAFLIIGLSALNAPFKSGVLVASPDMIIGPLGTDATGSLDLSSFWPSDVPSAFVTYFQYWIPDAGGPMGFAASNGLTATTP